MRADIHIGDCRDVLAALPAGSVHCCVTSPPYFGLRDYGTATWNGGDPACEHSSSRRGHGDEKQATSAGTSRDSLAGVTECRICGATRADRQLGLEPTLDAYIETMVGVFREVRRVLRDDGTLWLNIGDSYANDAKWGGSSGGKHVTDLHGSTGVGRVKNGTGLKPKDLMMVPARLALALQADGWWIRSEIVWAKKAPMPESVTDRPTSSHEKVFLLTKSERYYYDAAAVREKASGVRGGGFSRAYADAQPSHGAMRLERGDYSNGRNLRNVWHLGPEPFPEAHFATFPTEIPRRAILAGSPEGGTVLDPFNGAGTTGVVAGKLGRDYIGIELNPAYAEMSEARILREVGPLLVTTEIHGLAIEATP